MKLNGDRCQCQSCARYFNSTAAFEAHRVTVEPSPNYRRRCMTDAELTAAGYLPNAAGFWRQPMPADVLARRLA